MSAINLKSFSAKLRLQILKKKPKINTQLKWLEVTKSEKASLKVFSYSKMKDLALNSLKSTITEKKLNKLVLSIYYFMKEKVLLNYWLDHGLSMVTRLPKSTLEPGKWCKFENTKLIQWLIIFFCYRYLLTLFVRKNESSLIFFVYIHQNNNVLLKDSSLNKERVLQKTSAD